MKRKRQILAGLLLVSPLGLASARADTVTLMDGRVIRKVEAHREGDGVRVTCPLGSTSYSLDEVLEIATADSACASPAPWAPAAPPPAAPFAVRAAPAPGAPPAHVPDELRGLTPEGAARALAHKDAVERAKERRLQLEARVVAIDAANECERRAYAARERAQDSAPLLAMPAYPDSWVDGCGGGYQVRGSGGVVDLEGTNALLLIGSRQRRHHEARPVPFARTRAFPRPAHSLPVHATPSHASPSHAGHATHHGR